MTDYLPAPTGGTATYVGDDGKKYTSTGWQQGTEPNTPGVWQSYQGADGQTYYRDLGAQMSAGAPAGTSTGGASAPQQLLDMNGRPMSGQLYVTDANARVRTMDGNTIPVSQYGFASRLPDGRYVVDANTQFVFLDGETRPAGQYGYASPYSAEQAAIDAPKPAPQNPNTGGAIVHNLLHQLGLDEAIPMVDGWIQQGLSADDIEAMMYDRHSALGQIVDRIYPEVGQRADKGLKPMSIPEIQQYRQDAKQSLSAAGFSDAYTSNAYIQRFIVGDTSMDELRQRASEYADYGAQLAAHPEAASMLSGFQRYYGVRPTNADLATMALDPTVALPALKRRFATVGEDTAAQQSGYGEINFDQANQLVDAGVSRDQAVQGFGQLVQDKELLSALPGQEHTEDTISPTDQMGLITGNANAARRIRQQANQRVADFQGGGQFAQSKTGFGGIGTADT